jgi:hypothetical protein
MYFPRDSHLVSRTLHPRLPNLDKTTFKEIPNSAKRILEDSEMEDLIMKKRKLLDDKAPGLFELLTKFAQEETSTEAASVHSPERDSDEHKHMIHIPTPIKEYSQSENNNLSNAVKVNPQKQNLESFPIPISTAEMVSGKNVNTLPNYPEVEEAQRQKILNIITYNTLMLNNIMNQQKNYQRTLFNCIETFKNFKDDMVDGQKTHFEKIEQIKKEKGQSSAFDSNPTAAALFSHLFGSKNDYKYELVLDNEIPSPIFRERNLVIKVKLINMVTKEVVKNQNKILLHLGLQTWEIPSSPILRNKTGNKAIMGETEIELVEGMAAFDRIQINEVTSKFIHGYIAMMVIPTKPTNYGTSLRDQGQGESYIKYEEIKPLMLEKIVVKSKKKNLLKKKNEQNE